MKRITARGIFAAIATAISIVAIAHCCGCASIREAISSELDKLDAAALLDRFLEESPTTGAGATTPAGGDAGEPIAAVQTGDDIDLGAVTWHGPDIRTWAVTSDLPAVRVAGGTVAFPHSMSGKWPRQTVNGAEVEANPWVIANVNGAWHAASFEWLRPGQQSKPTKTVAGDHCKVAPLNGAWKPKSGDTVYIGVSALARGSARSVAERTQFRRVVWP